MKSLRILGVVALALTVFCLAGMGLQRHLVYFPTHDIHTTPADVGLEFEDVWLDSRPGRIHGWWVAAKERDKPRGTVLFFHGNAANIADRVPGTVAFWAGQGFDLFIFDYQGFGKSDGKPGEKQTYADALAAWTYLTQERGVAPDTIVVHGRSLGGGISSWLVTQRTPGAYILESSFTSVPDLAREVYSWAQPWMVRIKYDTIGRIGSLACPILVAHSPDDDVIAYHHGQSLFAAAPETKTFLKLTGPHGGGWTQTENYAEALTDFLTRANFPE